MMKKGNILDIGMLVIRNSGYAEMHKKSNVQYWANQFGFYELESWLEELNTEEYLWYTHSIDTSYVESENKWFKSQLKKVEELQISRKQIEEWFGTEINDYETSRNLQQLEQLTISISEIVDSSMNLNRPLMEEINELVTDHAFNYLLPIEDGCVIVWFDDDFYRIRKNKAVPLDAKRWKLYYPLKEKAGKAVHTKYDNVNECLRLGMLLALE